MTIVVETLDPEKYFRSIDSAFREFDRVDKSKGNFLSKWVIIFALPALGLELFYFVLNSNARLGALAAEKISALIHITLSPDHLKTGALYSVLFLLLVAVPRFLLLFLRKTNLSERQLSFAYCWALLEELRKYDINRLDPHIQNALRLWPNFYWLLFSAMIPPNLYEPHPRLQYRIWSAVTLLGGKLPWFRLSEGTAAIVDALETLDQKLFKRIKENKDVSQVISCLSDLANYLYLSIPPPPSIVAQAGAETRGRDAAQIESIKTAISRQHKFLSSLIELVTRWEIEGSEIRLYFPTESRALAEILQARDPMERLRAVTSEVVGRPLRVSVKVEAPSSVSPSGAGKADPNSSAEVWLASFARRMNDLPGPKPEPSREISWRTLIWQRLRASNPLTHSNPILRFLSWYVFAFLVCALLIGIFLYTLPQVQMGAELVGVLVGAPMAVAAAALALSGNRK